MAALFSCLYILHTVRLWQVNCFHCCALVHLCSPLSGEYIFLKVDLRYYISRSGYGVVRTIWKGDYISISFVAVTNYQKLSGLKQYSFILIILEFKSPKSVSLVWRHGVVKVLSRTWETLWENLLLYLFHFLETTYIPWLMVPSFIFSASRIESSMVFLSFPVLPLSPHLLCFGPSYLHLIRTLKIVSSGPSGKSRLTSPSQDP